MEDLPQLMGQNSLVAARLNMARMGMSDEEDVDCELVASVVLFVAQYYSQGEGAILCFLPVCPHPTISFKTYLVCQLVV